MQDLHNVPIDRIEGIGPATKDLLESSQLFFVGDLIRVPVDDVYDLVSSVASEKEVWDWQGMALLMQVEHIDHQWAEALFRGGVETVSELSFQSLEKLQNVFDEALERQLINAKPTADQYVDIIRDATRLRLSNSLDGRVSDVNGLPVAGATVKMGGVEATTNSQGNFRLFGIPPSERSVLLVIHADHGMMMIADPELSFDDDTTLGGLFQFDHGHRALLGQELSELKGDSLPEITAFPIDTQTLAETELEVDDILQAYSFYKRSEHVKLLSRFKKFKDGEFLATSYQVSLSSLPKGLKEGQHFYYDEKGFEPIEFGDEQLWDELAARQAYKQIIGNGEIQSQQAFMAYLKKKQTLLNP